jgi:3-methyladenine DNA glycosylase/8-oxoguanine DNA glycosylase
MPLISITTPRGFRYLPTVLSHGWCVLPPFSYDEETQALGRVQRLSDGTIARLTIPRGQDDSTVQADVAGAGYFMSDAQMGEIRRVVARIFGFDQDVERFYAHARGLPGYDWMERAGVGRMLVSPTVWEDLAKTLLTTNTTWSMTKGMVNCLAALGEADSGGDPTFPTPEQVAALTPEALNEQVRAGYRGAYLHALAAAIAEGRMDPEAWRDPALSSADVYRHIKSIKGFGDYAAGAMMRLLWRFDELGLDSVCRTMFKTRYNNGAAATDREIAAHYAPFGAWRGLAVWMDVIRENYEGA